jgi:hypothetical protein
MNNTYYNIMIVKSSGIIAQILSRAIIASCGYWINKKCMRMNNTYYNII